MKSLSTKQVLVLAHRPGKTSERAATDVADLLSRHLSASVEIRREMDLRGALLEGRADLALQQAEDLRGDIGEGEFRKTILPRSNSCECLFVRPGEASKRNVPPFGLKPEAKVRVTSLRQAGQLGHAFQTEVEIVEEDSSSLVEFLLAGHCDAIMLPDPAVGMEVLSPALEVIELRPEVALSAPGQGVLILERRAKDDRFAGLSALGDPATAACFACEGLLLTLFENHPGLGCLATVETGGAIRLQAALTEIATGDTPPVVSRVAVVSSGPDMAAQACFDLLLETRPRLRRTSPSRSSA